MRCIGVNEIFKDEKENIIIVFEDNRERCFEC
jgi:hypothetical protein